MQLTRISTAMPPGMVRLLKPFAMPLLYPKMRRFFSMFMKSGDLVFDIGAHEGELAEVFLALGASVVCVEPNPRCAKALSGRFAPGRPVRVVRKGVGEKEGKMEFHICESSSSLSTFSKKWKTGRYRGERWIERVTVSMTTMDSLMRSFGKPRFCKIDVEGYELQILRGMSSPIPALSFEFTKEFIGEASSCARRLSEIGMGRFNYSPYSESYLSLERWVDAEELLTHLAEEKSALFCGDVYAISDSAAPPGP